jgi:hypothetical protein
MKPKIHMEAQITPSSHSNPEQKSNSGGIITPDFKLYYSSKNSMVLAQNRCINQWTIIKDQKQAHKLHPSDGRRRWQKHSSERKKKTAS